MPLLELLTEPNIAPHEEYKNSFESLEYRMSEDTKSTFYKASLKLLSKTLILTVQFISKTFSQTIFVFSGLSGDEEYFLNFLLM